ncbi:hypothetical protein Q8W25_17830 [Shimia thalassica]|uniref:hypothetical protein n=1 Tax=Shimia thalassica TaxID=1715693 RepID=UPI0027371A96|nr:hypothetical protein [Shimia thalassica]MDP2495893.1 hypothetical protein [Shimia thalassica]
MTEISYKTRRPTEPNALIKSLNEIEAWLESGQSTSEIQNETSFTESVFLVVNELRFLQRQTQDVTSHTPNAQLREVLERALVMTQICRNMAVKNSPFMHSAIDLEKQITAALDQKDPDA